MNIFVHKIAHQIEPQFNSAAIAKLEKLQHATYNIVNQPANISWKSKSD